MPILPQWKNPLCEIERAKPVCSSLDLFPGSFGGNKNLSPAQESPKLPLIDALYFHRAQFSVINFCCPLCTTRRPSVYEKIHTLGIFQDIKPHSINSLVVPQPQLFDFSPYSVWSMIHWEQGRGFFHISMPWTIVTFYGLPWNTKPHIKTISGIHSSHSA